MSLEFFQDIKEYANTLLVAIIGYLGYNHKRIDKLISEQSRLVEKVNNLEADVTHIRDGVDRLTMHLLDKQGK